MSFESDITRLERALKKQRELVAVAYAPHLDGWTAHEHKRLRNPASPLIVWMRQSSWQELANCASRDGEFFIPCTEGRNTNVLLRKIISTMESPDDNTETAVS
jgi:hypothetical protein